MKIFDTNSDHSELNAIANVVFTLFTILMAVLAAICCVEMAFTIKFTSSVDWGSLFLGVLIIADIWAVLLTSIQRFLTLNEGEARGINENPAAKKFVNFFGEGYKGYIITLCLCFALCLFSPLHIAIILKYLLVWTQYVTVFATTVVASQKHANYAVTA